MPRQKAGKYIECELEGCTKTKYYTPSQIKRLRNFFCSNKHSGLFRTKRIETQCALEECTNVILRTPSELKNRKDVYCCTSHANIGYGRKRTANRPICALEGCTNVVNRPKSKIIGGFCSHKCSSEARKTGSYVECHLPRCETIVYHSYSDIQRNENHYCCLEHRDKAYTLYPKTAKLRNKLITRQHNQRYRDNLDNIYLKKLLGFSSDDKLPKDLIEFKKHIVKRKRQITQIRHAEK